eukprot:TRINITY_DN9794_c0_g1_i1.p1 TRINITY_DN9794_c0_g1~~TRINITY_DN9794_c0_g1_i1.p1  ORF type:complete len:376 (-),score=82.48 TRINITY_DN9794_c0_g1_i1:63-1190(-)
MRRPRARAPRLRPLAACAGVGCVAPACAWPWDGPSPTPAPTYQRTGHNNGTVLLLSLGQCLRVDFSRGAAVRDVCDASRPEEFWVWNFTLRNVGASLQGRDRCLSARALLTLDDAVWGVCPNASRTLDVPVVLRDCDLSSVYQRWEFDHGRIRLAQCDELCLDYHEAGWVYWLGSLRLRSCKDGNADDRGTAAGIPGERRRRLGFQNFVVRDMLLPEDDRPRGDDGAKVRGGASRDSGHRNDERPTDDNRTSGEDRAGARGGANRSADLRSGSDASVDAASAAYDVFATWPGDAASRSGRATAAASTGSLAAWAAVAIAMATAAVLGSAAATSRPCSSAAIAQQQQQQLRAAPTAAGSSWLPLPTVSDSDADADA